MQGGAQFFPRPCIYRKLLLGFSVVGGLSAILAIGGIFQLYRIETITVSLAPQVDDASYLQEATLALEAIDGDFERYTTVGGQDARDRVASDLHRIERATASIHGRDNAVRAAQ